MKTIFTVSFVIFIASTMFFMVTIPINCGLANPMFDNSHDGDLYIEQMRAIINVFDIHDKLATMIMLISAISSGITGFIAKKNGQM